MARHVRLNDDEIDALILAASVAGTATQNPALTSAVVRLEKAKRKTTRAPMSRDEAIEQYIVLRCRTEQMKRMNYLLMNLAYNMISVPQNSDYSHLELADVVRVPLFGWLAGLLDTDTRAVDAFGCLYVLFPLGEDAIRSVQEQVQRCNREIQDFRNNISAHLSKKMSAHLEARAGMIGLDVREVIIHSIACFFMLMENLIKVEHVAIPELARVLEEMKLTRVPFLAGTYRAAGMPSGVSLESVCQRVSETYPAQ